MKLNIGLTMAGLEISQTRVNRNKQRLLNHTSYGSFVKKHQAIGGQCRRETVSQLTLKFQINYLQKGN